MIRLQLFLFLLVCVSTAEAQDQGTLYYDAGWGPKRAREHDSYYYRCWAKVGDLYEIHDYYHDHTPLLSGYLTSLSPDFWPNRMGNFVYFHDRTGKKISEGDFKKGRRNGLWKYYEANNDEATYSIEYVDDVKVREFEYYTDGKALKKVSIYESGREVSSKSYYENGKLECEYEYPNGLPDVKHCYGIDGKDTACNAERRDSILKMPTPPKYLQTYVAQNMHYPDVAREKGKMGRLAVSFIVFKDGNIGRVVVERHLDPAIDEEGMRVLTAMPDWGSGKHGVKQVKVLVTEGINFILK